MRGSTRVGLILVTVGLVASGCVWFGAELLLRGESEGSAGYDVTSNLAALALLMCWAVVLVGLVVLLAAVVARLFRRKSEGPEPERARSE